MKEKNTKVNNFKLDKSKINNLKINKSIKKLYIVNINI